MHERIVDLYDRNAEAWDEQRRRDLHEQPWLDRFAALLPRGGTILDIGCGMGEPVASYLIGLGFSITGIDSSPSLIGMCRKRFPDQEWLVVDMRELALDRRFDGVLAWHSFFHLTPNDQQSMFPTFAAHCSPLGGLMFTSGTGHGEAIGEWQGQPLYHGSLAPTEYRALLATNAFDVLENRVRDPECAGATIWLARKSNEPGI